MVDLDPICSKWSPRLLSVLRIVAAMLFMQHGAQKLFGLPADPAKVPVELFSLMGLAGVLEFFAGLLLLIGLFTRPVAFLVSGQMAVAYFMAHAQASFFPIVNKGELAVLYCFVFLFIAARGSGIWALDGLLWRRR